MSEKASQPPTEGDYPQTLEQRLASADLLEKERAQEFLEQSRPNLIGGKTLPWDRFWSWLGGGVDGVLWSWVASDVEAARAREDMVHDKNLRAAKKTQNKSAAPSIPKTSSAEAGSPTAPIEDQTSKDSTIK